MQPERDPDGRARQPEETEQIAATDAYASSADARVIVAADGGVVLDRTVFYPRGGGQPGDTGELRPVGGASVRVADTVKRVGQIVHMVDESFSGSLRAGVAVKAVIDWDRRHLLMRTHTALHSLTAVVLREYGAKVTGGNMEPGVARMDFELDPIPEGWAPNVEERLNAALAEDHPVQILFLPRAEAMQDPDLIRTKVSLIPESVDPIRVVDIVGLDRQADGGTHVRSTAEVGRVRVVKTESKGKSFKRMRIEVVDA
jgi:misacylated tRNA(Ala) deacylase